MEEEKRTDSGSTAEAPDEPEKEGSEAEPEEEESEKENEESKLLRKRKKRAVIFLVCILAAFAVVIPLLFIDFGEIRNELLGIENKKIYYSAPEEGDIWENERYLELRPEMRITVRDGDGSITYGFGDRETANEAFGLVGAHDNGASVLGEYFTFLINGVEKEEYDRFSGLFSKNYQKRIPTRFYPQKIFNIILTYEGKKEDQEELYCWEARFEVLDNDGFVVNYFDNKDHGRAVFYLEESLGKYRIAAIETRVDMGQYGK